MKRMPKRLSENQIDKISSEISDNISNWLNKSKIPQYAKRWFLQAKNEACKSNSNNAKIGCVIVYKNHIIGRGHNQIKTDPFQKKYNSRYRKWTNDPDFSKTQGHTLHAEIDALRNIPYTTEISINWKKVDVYIYRIGLGLEGYSGLALPCEACAHALSDKGILGAYYTTGHLDRPFGYCDL